MAKEVITEEMKKLYRELYPDDAIEMEVKEVVEKFQEEKKELVETVATILDQQGEKIDKALNTLDTFVNQIEERIDEIDTRVEDKYKVFEQRVKTISLTPGPPGPPGKTRTDAELQTLLKPLIPKPVPGPRGDPGRPGITKEGKPGKSVEVQEVVGAIMPSVLSRLNQIIPQVGSGNMNRNVAIGGNPSVLSRYTDMNLKAGSNVTITYVNNDTTKYTDITIAATGGGGTVRSINSINTSQAAASVVGTDYVYICSAGVQLTLPTAVGNTNLYTVKNTSTSSVLVATVSAQTIDNQSNAILATQYTSIDLISDGSNWDIT